MDMCTTPHKHWKHALAFDGNSSIIPNIDTIYHLILQAYSIGQSNGESIPAMFYIILKSDLINFTINLIKFA